MRIQVYNVVRGNGFFERLLAEWREAGAEVELVHAVTEARYRSTRGRIARALLRWRMTGGFASRVWRSSRAGARRPDVRIATTNPFFVPALVRRTGGGAPPTVQLLFDLYPDALVLAGTTRAGSALARRCAALTRFALRECAATVFLGSRLRSYAEQAYGSSRYGRVIAAGADAAPFRAHPPRPSPAGRRPRVLYCGLLGRMHDAATLAGAWDAPEATAVDWTFHASGAGYERLRSSAGERAGVRWGGPLADEPWADAMRSAEIALVTVAPGAENVVMPSKTYSALAAGQAVLAVTPSDSDLAELVRRHACGWVVSPGDVGGLRAALARIASSPGEVLARREAAFAAGQHVFDMRAIAAQWLDLLGELRR